MKQKQPNMNEKQKTLSQVLDQHSDSYDAATLSKLRQAREKALVAADKKPVWFAQPLPAAFASVCILAVGVFLFSNNVFLNDKASLTTNEVLLDDNAATAFLSNDIDLEFYEDIEFYEWLDQSGANSDAG